MKPKGEYHYAVRASESSGGDDACTYTHVHRGKKKTESRQEPKPVGSHISRQGES